MQTPTTRLELFQVIARAIGWGTTVDDVEGFAEKIEALGVRFVPSVPTQPMMHFVPSPASLGAAIAASPFAPPQKKPGAESL